MSSAEIKAQRLYDSMQLDDVSEEVKRHLMILMLSGASKPITPTEDVESLAQKLAVNDEHLQEMREHKFYSCEEPVQLTFVTEEQEQAYYDSMTEKDFLSEEDSARMMSAWRNL